MRQTLGANDAAAIKQASKLEYQPRKPSRFFSGSYRSAGEGKRRCLRQIGNGHGNPVSNSALNITMGLKAEETILERIEPAITERSGATPVWSVTDYAKRNNLADEELRRLRQLFGPFATAAELQHNITRRYRAR